MATLGSIYHDFPRLAKQSGFYFQLHTGRVNWSEIENLDIDEIIQKRNYELLERNLMNVINCNLEREYDLKILDQNFVKLFKLAQLGIDYLSYCEMYLDRCVVLLQEQLTAFQQEYESLKQDNGKRKQELNKNKRKNRMQNYQCEKCEKVFISDVYLKFHDKRRHSNPNTPNSLDIPQIKSADYSQQTESGRKLSTSTQTLLCDEMATGLHTSGDGDNIKKEHTVKIEKLEQELKDLKDRLKKAESSLIEKVENSHPQSPKSLNHSNVLYPLNGTGSMCCNSMLMLLPSFVKQTGSGYYEFNSSCQMPNAEVCQRSDNSGTTEIKLQPENEPITELGLGNTQINRNKGLENENGLSKQNCHTELSVEEKKPSVKTSENFQDYHSEINHSLDCNKENIDPNLEKNILRNLAKPLPPPRKLKKGIRTQSLAPFEKTVEKFTRANKDNHKEEEAEGFSSSPILHISTPKKEKPYEETDWEILEGSRGNLSEINKPGSNSTESLNSRKSISIESKSFIKKIVPRNSPKLRTFRKNLKRSLTNLYDSVSSTEKDSQKKQSSEQNLREAVINGLNNRLRELGVDPEWQGIPKKSMKQKLEVLKHHRKLLSKDTPMLPVIRKNIQEKIFQKIKNNWGRKKTALMNRLTKQESTAVDDPPIQDILPKDEPDFVRVKKSCMYDTDTDSESEAQYSEGNFSHAPNQTVSQKSIVLEELTSSDEEEKVSTERIREFDFSVFQVGGGSLNSLLDDTNQKNGPINKKDEVPTDSETEDNFVRDSEEKIFKTLLNSYPGDENRTENNESPKNYENTRQQLEISHTKAESHGILKEESLQSSVSMSTKKRVLFANYSDGIAEELSDSPIDDDLWPFKSDSEKDVG